MEFIVRFSFGLQNRNDGVVAATPTVSLIERHEDGEVIRGNFGGEPLIPLDDENVLRLNLFDGTPDERIVFDWSDQLPRNTVVELVVNKGFFDSIVSFLRRIDEIQGVFHEPDLPAHSELWDASSYDNFRAAEATPSETGSIATSFPYDQGFSDLIDGSAILDDIAIF